MNTPHDKKNVIKIKNKPVKIIKRNFKFLKFKEWAHYNRKHFLCVNKAGAVGELKPYNQFHTDMAHKATVEEWLQTAEDVPRNNHANE